LHILFRVLEFNKYDLYTKDDSEDGNEKFDIEDMWKYYGGLLSKFNLDGELDW
jgi:hypothetical protein